MRLGNQLSSLSPMLTGCIAEGSMALPHTERRLSAILVADAVGYSRLVEIDEQGTLSALRNLRHEVLDPLWPTMGDASSSCSGMA